MSKLHIRHIESRVVSTYQGLIDMSDAIDRPQTERESMFLSRGLAAYTLESLVDITPDQAAFSLTDGFDDNGIDAVHFDTGTRTLYLVQSKWSRDGNSSPSQREVLTFVAGINDVIDLKLDRFNERLRKHEITIREALQDPNLSIGIILTHTGQHSLGRHAHQRLEDMAAKVNDVTDVLWFRVLGQAEVHGYVAAELDTSSVNLDVTLHDWGTAQDPYVAYYGQIAASDIAQWWATHGSKLFARNLRNLIQESDVNNSIVSTLLSEPEHFWYFNNGITVLCDSVHKLPIGGSQRRTGQFRCEGATVVNGAQTVGSIGRAAAKDEDALTRAWVLARFISLDNGSVQFASSVTRATNTQNRIERRDFVSLDPQQQRLRRELELEGKFYALKTGEDESPTSNSCSVLEATNALACAHRDSTLAVTAKREVGLLWADLDRPPYTDIFNARLTSTRLWRCVEVLRTVEHVLRQQRYGWEGRHWGISIHGNRLILHLVFQSLSANRFDDVDRSFEDAIDEVSQVTPVVLAALTRQTDLLYPQSYLASLFKNASKSKELVTAVQQELANPVGRVEGDRTAAS